METNYSYLVAAFGLNARSNKKQLVEILLSKGKPFFKADNCVIALYEDKQSLLDLVAELIIDEVCDNISTRSFKLHISQVSKETLENSSPQHLAETLARKSKAKLPKSSSKKTLSPQPINQ